MSTVTIELPEPIQETLRAQGEELPRFFLEAAAVEGYRREALTQGKVGEMLGLNFWQTEEFLKAHGAYLHYDEKEFELDMATLTRLGRMRG